MLEFGDEIFPVSKEIKSVFVLPMTVANNQGKVFASVQDESDIWHRRVGPCNIKNLKQLAEREGIGIKLSTNVQDLDYHVCSVSKHKKSTHPRSDRPQNTRRLELVLTGLRDPRVAEPYTGCKYLAIFTDEMSRMCWIYALKSKDDAVEALREFDKDVADPERLCIGRIRCDGGGEFQGRSSE